MTVREVQVPDRIADLISGDPIVRRVIEIDAVEAEIAKSPTIKHLLDDALADAKQALVDFMALEDMSDAPTIRACHYRLTRAVKMGNSLLTLFEERQAIEAGLRETEKAVEDGAETTVPSGGDLRQTHLRPVD
mgnify:CR=1 FL=1